MEIIYSPLVIKKLKKINPSDLPKIKKKVLSLQADPLSGKVLKGEFSGLRSLKVWPLRIIYAFDPTAQIVNIITIDYRQGVYKK